MLSVPFPSYEVTESMPSEGEEYSKVFLLGYEYPGIQTPDWIQVLKRKIANPGKCE